MKVGETIALASLEGVRVFEMTEQKTWKELQEASRPTLELKGVSDVLSRKS